MQTVRSITCGEFYFRGPPRKNKVSKRGPNLGHVCTLRQAWLLRKLNSNSLRRPGPPAIPPMIRAIYGHCD